MTTGLAHGLDDGWITSAACMWSICLAISAQTAKGTLLGVHRLRCASPVSNSISTRLVSPHSYSSSANTWGSWGTPAVEGIWVSGIPIISTSCSFLYDTGLDCTCSISCVDSGSSGLSGDSTMTTGVASPSGSPSSTLTDTPEGFETTANTGSLGETCTSDGSSWSPAMMVLRGNIHLGHCCQAP